MKLSAEFAKAKERIDALAKKIEAGKKLSQLDKEFLGRVERFLAPHRPTEISGKLPVFRGLEPCYTATGIPEDLMRDHRDAGAPGFRGGKVNLGDYLPWLVKTLLKDPEGRMTAGVLTAKQSLEQTKDELAKFKLAQLRGDLVSKKDVGEDVGRMLAMLFTALERVLQREAPAELHHLSERDFSKAMAERVASFKRIIREGLSAWAVEADALNVLTPDQMKQAEAQRLAAGKTP